MTRVKDDDGGWLPKPDARPLERSPIEEAVAARGRHSDRVVPERYTVTLGRSARGCGLVFGLVLLASAVPAGLPVARALVGGGAGWPHLFLAAFALVLLLGGGYLVLAVFNPRLGFQAACEVFDPAAPHTVRWSFSRPPRRVGRVQVRLVGREHATYQQGTSSVTVTEAFHESTLYDSDEAGGAVAAAGEVELAFPPGAMHSFESSNNKVRWTLEAKGWVPMFPDIRSSATLTVWSGPHPETAGGTP